MSDSKTKNPISEQILKEMKTIKGMVGNQGKVLNEHGDDIAKLKKYNEQQELIKKAAKEAVEEYKKTEAENSKKLPDNQWLTKELLSVIIKLIALSTALVALLKFGGSITK